MANRMSKPRARLLWGVFGVLSPAGSLFYSLHRSPEWIAISLFYLAFLSLAFATHQSIINHGGTDRFANSICGAIVVIVETGTILIFILEYGQIRLPQFSLQSAPAGFIVPSEKIPLSHISGRRTRILNIYNPNPFPLSAVFKMQFPEAILSVSPCAYLQASSGMERGFNVEVNGAPETNLVLEPLGTNEPTGIWLFTITGLPGKSSIEINILSAAGTEAGLFGQAITKFEGIISKGEADGKYVWGVFGNFWNTQNPEFIARRLFAAIQYNATNRAVAIQGVFTNISSTDLMPLSQGVGVSVPGLFEFTGYVILVVNLKPEGFDTYQSLGEFTFYKKMMKSYSLRMNNILAPPTLDIWMTNGSDLHIGK